MHPKPDNRRTNVFQRLDTYATWDYTFREYIKRFAWEWIQLLLIRPSFRRANGWRRFWLSAFGAKADRTCSIQPGLKVLHPWKLSVGSHSVLGNCTIWNPAEVSIGEQTVISQGVYICSGTHDYRESSFPLVRVPVRIGNGVWIAANAFIGPGSLIGENSVVGACAVVMGKVPAGVVVAGNPSRVIKVRVMNSDHVGSAF